VTRVKARGSRAKVGDADTELLTSKLRLLAVALVCAKLASVPVVIDPASDLPFIVPKVLVSHGLSYVLAGVLVALLVQFGRQLAWWSWLHMPVAAFLLTNVAATAVAENTTLALFGTHARMLGLGSIADGVLLYVAVVIVLRRRAEVVAVIGSVVAASIVILAYELVQVFGRDPFSWSFDGSISPFSTLGQPTTLAFYLTIVGLMAFALGVSVKELDRLSRTGLLVYAGVLMAGSVATGTRSALVGVATGAVVLGTALWLRQPTRRARVATGVGVVAASLAVAFAVVASPLGNRLTTTIQAGGPDQSDDVVARLDPSSVSRLALYGIAFDIVRERPILGYGPDNFIVGVPKFRPESAPPPIRQSVASSAHSWLAYVATSSGLIGLCAFVAIVVIAMALALQARSGPLAPVAGAALGAYVGTGLTTVTDVSTDALFWLSVGAIARLTGSAQEAPDQPHDRATRRGGRTRRQASLIPRATAIVAVGLGVALLIGTSRAAEASRLARASQDSRLVRAIPRAVDTAVRATHLDPNRSEYWQQLGLAYVGGSRWREASVAFERAVQLAPHDVRHVNDLIAVHLVLFSSGDPASRSKVAQLADQAVRVDPNNPGIQLTRATAMQATGNLPEALRSVERALALDPQSTNERLYATAAQIYLGTGRPADAVRVARQGRAILGVTQTHALGFELARALLANGQPREALTEIDLVLSLQPNYPAAERLRADITARLGS
jgi:O-antigen ligase